MAVFFFSIQNGAGGITAENGVDLPNLTAAKDHATEVARELMKGDELKKRFWRIDVLDEGREVVAALPFAVVDPTLDHLKPELRAGIERLSETRRECEETLCRWNSRLVWLRAMGSGLTRRPHLVARDGQRI